MKNIKGILAALVISVVVPTAVIAQEVAAGAPQPSALGSLVPMILVVLVFYFIAIRPQNKKFKAHREMTASLQKGATVITAGGIEAVVTSVDGNNFMLEVEIAPGVRVNVVRSTITELIANKGEEGAKKASSVESVEEKKAKTPAKKATTKKTPAKSTTKKTTTKKAAGKKTEPKEAA